MAYYLNKKEQAYYNKHNLRRYNKKSTEGMQKYSAAFITGFHNVWDDDFLNPNLRYKNKFEKTAFAHGEQFANRILKRK